MSRGEPLGKPQRRLATGIAPEQERNEQEQERNSRDGELDHRQGS
ncbi:MAG TPA: hypothetical protein VFM94_00230 [Solirubrobacterales bacterium]|nr:hypothetical protein [Solirubrobacterales bacterium]